MTIETSTYPSQWNSAYPEPESAFTEGDDHIRKIKANYLAAWPNLTAAAVTASTTELNYVDGVTSAIQTQLDAKAPLASPALTGNPTSTTQSAGLNNTYIATTATVWAAVGGRVAGAVGTYVLAKCSVSGGNFGDASFSGSTLTPVQIESGGTLTDNATPLSGTWTCMGYNLNSSTASLFLRTA